MTIAGRFLEKIMVASQPLEKTIVTSQLLKKTKTTVRLLDFALVVEVISYLIARYN